ncbi:MAG TPA: hypothetical protein VF816_18835 [Rhodocyclaceae bacterium]
MSPRLVWEAHRLLRTVGWHGAAALALIVAAAVIYGRYVAPLRDEVASVQGDADVLRAKVASRRAEMKSSDPVSQLSEFYDFFPGGDAMANTLESLQTIAAAENLALEQGEYRLAKESSGRLFRYDIVLPVKGPYPKLRRFIAQALRDNPSLALDSVSFSRQAALSATVDAQVRMILYLKDVQ